MASQVVLTRQGPVVRGRLGLLRELITCTRGIGFVFRSLLRGSLKVGEITVCGHQRFREQVAAALRLLRAHAPESFALCERYLGTVIMSRHSGVDVKARPAIVMFGASTISGPPRWLASDLAHEAFHCHLYWSHRERHPAGHVPEGVFSGEDAERECVEYQISVLKQLGGTDQEVAHLRDVLKTEYWKVPWHKRTW